MKKTIFLIVLINAILIVLFLGQQFNQPDVPCYVAGARLIFGLAEGGDCSFRMLKPLPLIFSGLLEKITGINAKYGFFIQNLIFYVLSAFLIFEIIKLVFKDRWQALLGTIAFITAPPLLVYGLGYLTDMGGWFFVILGVYLTVKFFEAFKENHKLVFIFGLILGLGFLFKEAALGGAVFFAFFVLFNKLSLLKKVKLWGLFSLGYLLPIILSSLVIFHYFGYTFFDWFRFNEQKPYGDYYHLIYFIKDIGATLYLYWFLFIIGIFGFLRKYLRKSIDINKFIFLAASGITILLWFIWSYPMNRIFYLSAPFLIALVSYGARMFTKKQGLFLLTSASVLNFLVVVIYNIYKEDFVIIIAGGIIYSLFFISFLLYCCLNSRFFNLAKK